MPYSSTVGPSAVAHVLVFELARQSYALPIKLVREVLPLAALIDLPGAPAGLAGLLRLRGGLLPIIELRQRLGLPAIQRDIDQRIVVMEGIAPLGLLVDAVHGVLPTGETTERETGAGQGRLIRHVFDTSQEVVLLLDAEAIAGPELRALFASTLTHLAEVSVAEEHRAVASRPLLGTSPDRSLG